MTISELNLKLQILKMIKKEFPTAFAFKTADRFRSGIPDLYVLLDGRSVWFELKRSEGGVVAPIQQYYIDTINKCQGEGFIVRSVSEVRNILKGGKA